MDNFAGRTVLFTTLGCKVNQYDSGALAAMLRARGFHRLSEPRADEEKAETGAGDADACGTRICPDVVVVNTCIVTGESERKSRQAIRRMRARYPGALLAVAGCWPEKYPEKAAAFAGADLVAGTSGHEALAAEIAARFNSAEGAPSPSEAASDAHAGRRLCEFRVGDMRISEHTYTRIREYIKVQDGCDRFCSYCVIPYTRGRARSRDIGAVLDEARATVARGVSELVLTGIHISSYDGTPKGGMTSDISGDMADMSGAKVAAPDMCVGLADLVRMTATEARRADRGVRIRLSSLEPTVVTAGFVDVLAENGDVVCPHFHLSLQSGSAAVLSRMNRGYTPDGYREAVRLLRGRFPEAAITTDVIAGFPGESESEFAETLAFCRELAFAKIHVFPYSRRPGTRAAEMPCQTDAAVKRERVKALLALDCVSSRNFRESRVGTTVRVLVETARGGMPRGVTGDYIYVRARLPDPQPKGSDAAERLIGSFIDVRVTGTERGGLIGTVAALCLRSVMAKR